MALLVAFAFIAGAGHGAVAVRAAGAARAAERRARRAAAGARSGSSAASPSRSRSRSSASRRSSTASASASSGARTLAIVFLAGFGIVTLVPALGDRLAAALSPLARFGPEHRAAPASGRASPSAARSASSTRRAPGRSSPRSSPSARRPATWSRSPSPTRPDRRSCCWRSRSAAARSASGSAAAGRGPALHRVLGAVMLATALAMSLDYDVRFQTAIADHLPDVVVNPTRSLETSGRVTRGTRRAARPLAVRVIRRRRLDATGNARAGGGAERRRRATVEPAAARRGAGLHRQPALVQHARRPAADARRAARARRARRLLDLHLHQLHPHAARAARLGRALPARGPDDRRRPLARVRLREGRRQRRRRDPPEPPALPGRPGQRSGDMERVGQPVLAGEVPDRRPRTGPLRRTSARASAEETEAAIRSLLSERSSRALGARGAP